METTERIHILEANLARQISWIALADSKSGLAFALDTAMLGVLAAVAPKQTSAWALAPAVFAFLAAGLSLASLVCLTVAAFPRIRGPRGSLVFFGGISQRSAEQFEAAVAAISDETYAEDLAAQCHRNAQIARLKFS